MALRTVVELSALDGNNGFEFDGSAAGDGLGVSVASAGDVNGDGFDDFIVGAPGASSLQAALAGYSYLVFGKAGGFAATLQAASLFDVGVTFIGYGVQNYTGASVASAGDINKDGYGDLIIGAYGADANSGVSYVYFGAKAPPRELQADLLQAGGRGYRIDGEAADDYSGISVSSAGDVNGDGYDDMIIGAYGVDTNGFESGAAYVVFGSKTYRPPNLNLSALDGTNGFQINGELAGDSAGFSVSRAGDVNGDGFADVIIGADSADPNGSKTGATYVLFGKASGYSATLNLSTLNGTNGFQINGEALEDYSGYSVSAAGDLNNDGYDDLLVGAYGANPNGVNSGASYVVFGKAGAFTGNLNLSALDGTNGFQINGQAAGDESGRSVAAAGDVNGDGFADLIIGAPRADVNGVDSGASYVVFGKASGFAANVNLSTLNGANGFQINGERAGDLSGYSVSGGGDINDDGFDDVIIGAPDADPNGDISGSSYVVFGASSGAITRTGTTANELIRGGEYNDTLDGGSGNDRLVGRGGDDRLIGAGGDDTLEGGAGNDILEGRSGMDIADYTKAASAVRISLLLTTAQNTLGAGVDTLVDIEIVSGSAFDDTLTGSAARNILGGENGDDNLRGLAGNDELIGSLGDDVLEGGAGDDYLDGGEGDDTASYASAGTGVSISFDGFGTQNTVGAGWDWLFNIENLVGSAYDDTLTGDGGANTFNGGAGNDRLSGADGADVLIGSLGDDVLDGGSGNDRISGGSGVDTASYDSATAGVTVSLARTAAQDTGQGVDTLIDIENLTGSLYADTLTGDAAANTLNGGNGADRLFGGGGADVLLGSGGDDVLDGGLGNDLLTGGAGNDTAYYASASSTVSVNLGLTAAQNTLAAGVDTLSGIENVSGSAYGDFLVGSDGANVIKGLGGNDLIRGGAGADVLTGGAGADTFVFGFVTDSDPLGKDRITDLGDADVIDLSRIDANGTAAGDTAFVRLAGDGAFTAAGQFRLTLHGADTWLELNTDGDTTAEAVIILSGDHTVVGEETGWLL